MRYADAKFDTNQKLMFIKCNMTCYVDSIYFWIKTSVTFERVFIPNEKEPCDTKIYV